LKEIVPRNAGLECGDRRLVPSPGLCCHDGSLRELRSKIMNFLLANSSKTLSLGDSGKLTKCEKPRSDCNCDKQPQFIDCDYVIIGHGKAGRSAARTLRTLDPNAHVVIIDPNNRWNDTSHKSSSLGRLRNSGGTMEHLTTRATFIEHSKRHVHFHPYMVTAASISDDYNGTPTAVRYRKSALIATGSRGAPPPDECIRWDAWSRILELRSTYLPPLQLVGSPEAMKQPTQPEQKDMQQPQNTTQTKPIPVLDPPTVRSLSMMAASQGARVAVMGSGWEALELAASLLWASSANKLPSHSSTRPSKYSSTQFNINNPNKISLLFGNAGPMSMLLPRYLSAAISKRLRQYGIEVEDRTMTRYISMDTPLDMSSNLVKHNDREVRPAQLQIYTVKSYDHLESKRVLADLLVLAPSVDGVHGTAVLPTSTTLFPKQSQTDHQTTSHSSNGLIPHLHHQPWSNLISPSLVTCFLDDGRISTNSELLAASSLYAAGSVAKYPNAQTGQADVAGGSRMSAELAGETAARNMFRDNSSSLHSSSSEHWDKSLDESTMHLLDESIPVWRSDRVPYLRDASKEEDGNTQQQQPLTLSLYQMGIHALCIGRCDSDSLATHGFWWTNTNQQQYSEAGSSKHNGNVNGNGKAGDDRKESAPKSRYTGPNRFMRRVTRKTSMSNQNGTRSSVRGALPVYGSGVVYYLDRSGNIQGVMLWGLPFSQDPKDVHSNLNCSLVKRMKAIIRSNGGVAIRDHSAKILEEKGVSVDVNLLSYLHLAEESRNLASMSLTGSLSHPHDFKSDESRSRINVPGRPLHRYTPCKSTELNNLNKMRRKDDMGYITEEDDLFYSKVMITTPSNQNHDNIRVEEFGRPPSLKRIYPMDGGNPMSPDRIQAEKEAEVRQRQMERSRPPKEEPLWIRRGEVNRSINWKETMADSFLRNMLSGKFSDGSEAVKQAPVPKIFSDAKDQWISLTSTGNGVERNDDLENNEET